VKRNPAASLVHDMKKRQRGPLPRPGRRRHPGPDAKHKTILADFGLAFAVMIYGDIPRRSLPVPFTPDLREDLDGG
jgi:uncharacterized ion transporter superfamily protein YfcC